MKAMKKTALVLCALLLLFALAPFAPADFGDYGGDSDYGGGYDSYDSYDSYDYDDDDSYGWFGGSDSYGGSSSKKDYYYHFTSYPDDAVYYGTVKLADHAGQSVEAGYLTSSALFPEEEDDDGVTLVGGIFFFCIVAIIVVIVVRRKRGGGPGFRGGRPGGSATRSTPIRSMAPGAQPTPQSQLKHLNEYYRLDPNFSEAELCEKISNRYVKFQNAWQDKNLEELRPYLTDAFYAQMDRQLDNYRRNRQTNRIERIAVLGVTLQGWQQRGGEDIMVARLRTRIVDYVTDDASGRIVRGSNTAEKFMEYEWTLTRKTGVQTGVNDGVRVQNCPNCGGVVNINRTARCPYCDSIITVEATDWAVSGIKGISQHTAGR